MFLQIAIAKPFIYDNNQIKTNLNLYLKMLEI